MQFVKRYPIPIALALAGVIALGAGAVLLTKKSSSPTAAPKISADVKGKGYNRTVVVKVKDRKNGAPIRGAEVTAQGQMTFPHAMNFIDKPLREVSSGTYRGPYTFIMKGNWTVNVDVVDKKGKESKASFPIVIG
jgi:YtkA-like protein